MLTTLELARAIEAVEMANQQGLVEARQRLGLPAEALPIGTGAAYYVGHGIPLTQAFGLGLESAHADDFRQQIAAVEAFFQHWNHDANVDVCNLSPPGFSAALAQAGFVPVEHSSVFVLPVSDITQQVPALPAGYHLEPLNPALPTSEPALRAIIEGFGLPANAANLEFQRVWYQTSQSQQWVVLHHGQPVAGANLFVHNGIAQVAGASTLPTHRGRGLQKALIATRLLAARKAGCQWAAVTTDPQGPSCENMRRRGFQVVYARTKWCKPVAAIG